MSKFPFADQRIPFSFRFVVGKSEETITPPFNLWNWQANDNNSAHRIEICIERDDAKEKIEWKWIMLGACKAIMWKTADQEAGKSFFARRFGRQREREKGKDTQTIQAQCVESEYRKS